MTSKNFHLHFFTLVILLIGVLIGCGITPATNNTLDPEGNGDPILSKMPVAALLKSITMPVTRANTRSTLASPTPASPEIKLTFASSMNRSSVENAINIYPSGIVPNSSIPKRLQVKATCDGGWQVRNPNDTTVSFEWAITKSVEQGAGMVAANGVQNLRTSPGFKQLRVISSGVVQARVLSVTGACAPLYEFIWAVDNKSVTVRPLQPISSDALTVAISTAAFSSDGVRLENPSTETLVPEQEVNLSQGITLTFPQAVNKSVLENSLKVFQGKFDPGTLIPTAPRVTQACDGSYTVQNPSSSVLNFSWSVEGTSESGTGTTPANGETKITPLNSGAIKVFTDKGVNITRVLEGSTPCSTQTFTTVWNADGSSVTLSPILKWNPGTFTIVGKAVNEAGASVARESLAVVRIPDNVVPPHPGTDPGTITPEEPLRAELPPNAFLPLVVAGESTTFDASASSGDASSYTWQFGDGETLEGGSVEKTFTDPGTYPVTLIVTNDAGVSDSVTSTVTIMPTLTDLTLATDLSGDHDTAAYDVGPAVPGLKYEWTISDSSGNTISQPVGSRVNVQYPKLGTFDVELNVLDYRDQLNAFAIGNPQTRSSSNRAATSPTPEEAARDRIDRSVVTLTSVDTRWALKPKAKLFMIGSDGVRRHYAADYANTDFTFDASSSVGRDLVYKYEICPTQPRLLACAANQSVVETSDPIMVRNLNTGEYLVKLTVIDKYAQIDETNAYITVNDRNKHFVHLAMDNPIIDPSARSALRQTRASNNGYSPSRSFQGLENIPIDPSAFPFVISDQTRLRRAATRWNDWKNGDTFSPTLCKNVAAFRNRRDFPMAAFVHQLGGAFIDPYQDPTGWVVYYNLGDDTDKDECDFSMVRDTALFPARTDEEFLLSGSQWHEATYIDSIHSLRVPKVILSVLQDDALDGAASTKDAKVKMFDEKYGTNEDGTQDLVYTVRLRASEMENNDLMHIKVPVYAVDENGVLLNSSGLFYGKFEGAGFTSDCGECVMIHGKAMLSVSFRPSTFGQSTNLSLDLSQVKLQSDENTCGSSSAYLAKTSGYTQFGCSLITTSSIVPKGVTNLEPLPTVWGQFVSVYLGRTLLGETADARAKFFAELASYGVKALDQIANFIPVLGSVKGFLESVNQCRTAAQENQRCDVGAMVFAGAFVLLDVIPGLGLAAKGLKAIGPLYKLGLGLERGIAAALKTGVLVAEYASPINKFIRGITESVLAGGANTFETVFAGLKDFVKPGWTFLTKCALNCKSLPQGVFAKLVESISESKAVAVLNNFVEKTGLKSAASICGLQLAKQFLGTLVYDFAKLQLVQFSLGTIINRFYDVLSPPESVDDAVAGSNAVPQVNTRGARPTMFPILAGGTTCPKARVTNLETNYGYNSTQFNNWEGNPNVARNVKPFIGQFATKANMPEGYLFAETQHEFKGKTITTQYAYLPDSPGERVPLLVSSADGSKTATTGRWNVRTEQASKAEARIAEDARYKAAYDSMYSRLISGERNIHHLVADNVWRGQGLTQEILERCGKQFFMDSGENLLELASTVASRDAAVAAFPGKVSNIIHNTSHPDYDTYVIKQLETKAQQRVGISIKTKSDWSSIDCGVMISIVKETIEVILRPQFLTNTLPINVLDTTGNYLR